MSTNLTDTERLGLLIQDAITDGIFPCAVAGVVTCSGRIFTTSAGKLYYGSTITATDNTLYDLASLTKPLATALSCLNLCSQGKLDLDMGLGEFFPNIKRDKRDIRLWMLLSHSSGMKAYHDLGNGKKNRFITLEEATREILDMPLEYEPGTRHIYSDLGYIVLSRIIEILYKKDLATAVKELVISPLDIEDMDFLRASCNQPRPETAPSCMDSKGQPLYGTVHDPNARLLGGVSGHAGLFANIYSILDIIHKLYLIYSGLQENPCINPVLLRYFWRPVHPDLSTWAIGFDTKSLHGSSAGTAFPMNSVGHLGFTGTSFWLDLDEGTGAAFLSNRTMSSLPNAQERLKKLRPQIHSLLWNIGHNLENKH